jgi:ComEC/Rec2-related protein
MAIEAITRDEARPAAGRSIGGARVRPPTLVQATMTTWTGGATRVATAGRLRELGSVVAQDVALEVERGTPFLLVPVFMAAGALAYFGAPVEPPGWALAIALAGAGLFCLLSQGRGRLWHIAFAITLTLAGASLAKYEAWRAGTTMLASEISTRLTGRVMAIEHQPSGRIRVTLEVLATERPQLRYAPQNVRLTMAKAPAGLRAGAVLTGVARLRPASGPVRPGTYDFAFRSYFDRIGAVGFYMGQPDVEAPADAGIMDRLGARIENLRQATATRIRERIGGAEGEIAAALMVGVRAGIPEAESESLRRSGLYHIISISGLHMALVAWTVMVTIRACLAMFPTFAARHPTKKYAALAALLASAAYLAVSGAEVAAQRSFIMLAVMLAAILVDRAALTMRNLAISAIVVLVLTPHEIVGPSFQMSFAATAGIVAAHGIMSGRIARRERGAPAPSLPRRLAGMCWTAVVGLSVASLVAGLATAVFGAYHFQRVSPMGLPANLASMPLVSLVIVPSALLAAVTMPFGGDSPFLDAMGLGISGLILVSNLLAEHSPLDETGLVPGTSVVLLTVGLVAATVATTRLRWAALPAAAAGLMLIGTVRVPDVFVSEDARLVGANIGGELAVNAGKGNAFTLQNWSRAAEAKAMRRPDAAGAGDPDHRPSAPGFACADGTCRTTLPSGATVAHVADYETALRACAFADLIVVDAIPAPARCARDTVIVLSRQQLARYGSAELHANGPGMLPNLIHAISSRDRPWNAHRKFSRDARGIPPRPKPPAPDRGKGGPDAGADKLPPTDAAATVNTGGSDRPADPEP